jgi:hypothetical protein
MTRRFPCRITFEEHLQFILIWIALEKAAS